MSAQQVRFNTALTRLQDMQWIASYKDTVPASVEWTQGRLSQCCGSSFFGGATWNSMWDSSRYPSEKADWNLAKIIVAGFIEPDELPALNKDRYFVRVRGIKKDFLITWEDA